PPAPAMLSAPGHECASLQEENSVPQPTNDSVCTANIASVQELTTRNWGTILALLLAEVWVQVGANPTGWAIIRESALVSALVLEPANGSAETPCPRFQAVTIIIASATALGVFTAGACSRQQMIQD